MTDCVEFSLSMYRHMVKGRRHDLASALGQATHSNGLLGQRAYCVDICSHMSDIWRAKVLKQNIYLLTTVL